MKLLELFSGVGSQYRALKNINFPIEEVYTSEVDADIEDMYDLIHCKEQSSLCNGVIRLGDIKKIQVIPDVDLMTYSFPCQDISNQGKQLGLFRGDKSSLLWEVDRVLHNSKLPDTLLMENVSSITYPKFIDGLSIWMEKLRNLGYVNYLFKLNAKDFGIPQNRLRTFMVSRLKGGFPTKFTLFTIPIGKPTIKKFIDIKEYGVDEKYYRNETVNSRVYGKNVKHRRTDNYNYIGDKMVVLEDSYTPTLTAKGAQSHFKVYDSDKIRIVTPLECVRLMGFTDVDYDKIKHYPENKIRFAMGNSIVVNVLEEIFKNIYKK